MKRLFVIIAAAFFTLMSFSGCHGHDDSTATDLLTGTQGWVLSKAFSNPAYYMSENGTYASDLINDEYFKSFEIDDILVFNAMGGEIVKPGSIVAPSDEEGYTKETTLGNWEFDNPDKPTTITMYIPFLYQEGLKECKVLNLSKDEFRIRFTVEDNEEEAKKTCTFTLTYVPVK